MKAIRTKYISASALKPSRIKAVCEAGSVTLSYDHELDPLEMHRKALHALINKLQWQALKGTWHPGEFEVATYWTFSPK